MPDREAHHGVRYNVERFFARLENHTKIAVGYERTPWAFLALLRLLVSSTCESDETGSLAVKTKRARQDFNPIRCPLKVPRF